MTRDEEAPNVVYSLGFLGTKRINIHVILWLTRSWALTMTISRPGYSALPPLKGERKLVSINGSYRLPGVVEPVCLDGMALSLS